MVFGKYGINITLEDADRILKLLSLDNYLESFMTEGEHEENN